MTTTAKRGNVLELVDLARKTLGLSAEQLPLSQVLATGPEDEATKPQQSGFSKLLASHLQSGARPSGPRRPWTDEEFARAIGWNVEAVRHWRDGGRPPGDIEVILTVIFGSNPAFEADRIELVAARAKEIRATEPVPSVAFPTSTKTVGQEQAVDALVSAILRDAPSRAILVQGGPGFGKTTMTVEAGNRDAVRQRFGARRWVAYLDAATEVGGFDAALCRAVGLDPGIARFEAAFALLAAAPGLLVLDNLETPWEADRLGLEARLAQLQGAPDLVLMASVRGAESLGGANWTANLEIQPLAPQASRALFLNLAPRVAPDDMDLEFLLGELGGVPLAITLVALRASPFSDLREIRNQWEQFGVAFARRVGVEPSQRTSLARSIAFSVESRRVSEIGRHVFRTLGFLPGGLRRIDRSAICGPLAFDGAFELLAVGLAQERDDRLVLLPPVRDYARRLQPADRELRDACVNYFTSLVRASGSRIWLDGGGDAVRRLWPEWENIEAVLEECAKTQAIEKAKPAMRAVSRLLSTTGGGTNRVLVALETACSSASGANDPSSEAIFALTQGEIAVYRSDPSAESHFERAITHLARSGNAPDAQLCAVRARRGLAEVAIRRGQLTDAETILNETYLAARSIGDGFGEGYALEGLGECSSRRGDRAEARRLFQEALAPYKLSGQVLGVANATKCLADLSLQEERIDEAANLLETAGALYFEAEIPLGVANCRALLADIEVFRADHGPIDEREARLTAAFDTYRSILPIYLRVGDVLGEGNCHYNMAEVERRRGLTERAKERYAMALSRYERIREPTSIGLARRGLAQVSEGTERRVWLESAREAWIDLPHLQAQLRDL